jgi:hypothetical protein
MFEGIGIGGVGSSGSRGQEPMAAASVPRLKLLLKYASDKILAFSVPHDSRYLLLDIFVVF